MARKPTYEELEQRVRELEDKDLRFPKYNMTILQAIGHPILILDPDHGIIAANHAMVEMSSMPEKELMGKKCYEMFHQASQPPESCPMEKMLKSNIYETAEMEMEVVGRYFLVSCIPVLDDKGSLQRVIHMATDITDRKKAEEELRKIRKELELTIEATTDGIYKWNLKTDELFFSPRC
jgi:PAS domain S-box-containing protein